MQNQVFPSLEELSQAAAELIATRLREGYRQTGRFVLALSGGSTPVRTYEILASMDLPWQGLHVLWADERYVPPGGRSSNEGEARRVLLDRVPIPRSQIHGMYAQGGVEAAAARYDLIVRAYLAAHGIDLCVLGMGADGHTASLFPGSPALDEQRELAVAAQGAPPVWERVTLTPPALAASALNLFLVAGADKAAPFSHLLHPEPGTPPLPAAAVSAVSRQAVWFVDQAAAAVLPHDG
jgi:6-phosphogluconolactonase